MERVLVIDGNRTDRERLGLECLDRGTGALLAETLCDGVRLLLEGTVSLVVADSAALHGLPAHHATLFERVAPGVPVAALVDARVSLERRVALELAGFRVVTRPAAADELFKALPARELAALTD